MDDDEDAVEIGPGWPSNSNPCCCCVIANILAEELLILHAPLVSAMLGWGGKGASLFCSLCSVAGLSRFAIGGLREPNSVANGSSSRLRIVDEDEDEDEDEGGFPLPSTATATATGVLTAVVVVMVARVAEEDDADTVEDASMGGGELRSRVFDVLLATVVFIVFKFVSLFISKKGLVALGRFFPSSPSFPIFSDPSDKNRLDAGILCSGCVGFPPLPIPPPTPSPIPAPVPRSDTEETGIRRETAFPGPLTNSGMAGVGDGAFEAAIFSPSPAVGLNAAAVCGDSCDAVLCVGGRRSILACPWLDGELGPALVPVESECDRPEEEYDGSKSESDRDSECLL